MSKVGKKYSSVLEKIDKKKLYDLTSAISKLKEINYVKFDSTVEIAIRLSVDPKKADQLVRGTVVLPAGTGKVVRVLVLCKENKVAEATHAGADFVGLAEYIEKIQGGWSDVDVIVATPDVMVEVGKVGKMLGPKKLMPNPKSGTVTNDVVKAVHELKSGKIEYRVDKGGVIHVGVAKKLEIIEKVAEQLKNAKGVYLVDFHGVNVEDDVKLRNELKKLSGVNYSVVKNALIKKAIERSGVGSSLIGDLENATGVVFSNEDSITPGKTLKKLIQDNEKLEFKSAIVEGTYFGKGNLDLIASMASREENLSKVGGLVRQVVAGTPKIVNSLMFSLIYVIQEGSKKRAA
ncbi:hypothetical protein CHS0354_024096 [Potamilus streckersoni]|uniref:Large ribosomal subunit protein uL10m n=1 Tax=Potamilus streckersoni TaxID=2493646 RepID=A0AAE0VMQ7_9BIVA|nr:hypothetical protein CHS0354_024096 [Potamilus streckersoni]